MRVRPVATAEQLHSVALRYRWPSAGRTVSGAVGRRAWRPGRWGVLATPQNVVLGAGRDPRLRRLEAVLFLAREPLSSRKLSQYANLADGTEARTLVRRLKGGGRWLPAVEPPAASALAPEVGARAA
jgi:hypothetical protein